MTERPAGTDAGVRDNTPPVLQYVRRGTVRSFDPVLRGRRFLTASTALGGLLLLLSLPDVHQPGSPGFPTACLAYPAGLAALVLGVLGLYYSWGQPAGWPNLRWAGAAILLAMIAGGVSYTSVGWRVAFRLSRGSFENTIVSSTPPTAGSYGLFSVSDVTTDSGGGLWFQTKRRDAGFIWDYWYFGFVYKPTPGEDPIGNRNMLTLWPIGDGWYAFRTRWAD